MEQPVLLSEDECATILVGLSEFEAIISKKKKTFGVYEEINKKLIDKFRRVCWDQAYRRENKGGQ
jgi:hypothetical protein